VRVLLDQEVRVDHCWVFVVPEDDEDLDLRASSAGMRIGLLGAGDPGALSLTTALHLGEVPVRIELHDTAPDVAPVWEEVVETSFRTEDAAYALATADDRIGIDLPREVDLRVRCCATGVDAAYDGTRGPGDPELDRYLLQLWPAPPAPDALLRVTGERARYAHERARRDAAAHDATPPGATSEQQIRAEARARAQAVLDPVAPGRPAAPRPL